MFDGLFEVIGKVLSTFYDLTSNYALSIALLTLVVMVIVTPFTLKGTRSMIQMQILQPEIRRLQLKHRDDRQKLNEELMAFYRENNLNPLGGCLPLLIQAPILMILYNLIRGLTRMGDNGTFNPDHLDKASKLYESLSITDEMKSFGVDLAESASKALGEGFVHGLPHVVMVAIVAVSSYVQQKQIQGRNPNAEIPPQQKMLMRIFPAMFVFIAFVSPGALVVYFIVSNLYRIGMQAYITRALYHGEDSIGAKAQKAAKEAKALASEQGGSDLMPKVGRRKAVETTATEGRDPSPAPAKRQGSGGGGGSRPAPSSRTGAQNRSKKKRKRR